MDTQQRKQSRILVIGDSCTDIYHYGYCNRISQEAPVPIFTLRETFSTGGMAKNVYSNLQSLRNDVSLVTNLQEIRKERFIDEISMQHMLRCDIGEITSLSPILPDQIHRIDFKIYDAVVISDYDKGFLNNANIETIISLCSNNDVVIFVDSKRIDLSSYKNCFIKINELEFKNAKNIDDSCKVIITMGEKGASYNGKIFPCAKSEIDFLEVASSVKLLRGKNVCGAGDTFLSGFITEYLSTLDIEKSIKFANLCGSKAVENFGTYIVKPEDLE